MSQPAPPQDSFDGWSPPREFHEYRVVQPLGRGRNGRVYLAHDTLLDRAVAVKFVPAGSPEAMLRLLNEARAAARIQHPNVVTLYRVGQLDDYAYIVAEYTRGTSLDRVPRPQPSAHVHRYALDLARGLAAAHRAGVLHRDIKPGNAVLTEEDHVKLLDFGLAQVLEPVRERRVVQARPPTPRPDSVSLSLAPRSLSHGDLVGTPYYMPPEAWRGEEHSVRSDLYSLGALLYELCAGRAPFRHVPLSELADYIARERPTPLAELAPGIDAAFAAAVERCLRADPLDRFASADALLDALEAALGPENGDVPEGNPYRGLRPFEPEHRAFFFGRSRDLRELRDRLRGEAFLVLAGDSGVGKSSLAAAGLLPELESGALGADRGWRSARLVPGHHPLSAMADAIAPALGLDAVELEAALRAEPESLARRLRARLRADRGLVVLVDQLEELVTLAEPAEAERFAVALASLAEGLPGVRLLATARSDFLTRLAAVPRLGAPLARAIYLVRPLDREDLREAVVGPARMKGMRYENEALVESLVNSASGSGGLPLLQFALAELWEKRDEAARLIPAAALEGLGGVSGALARHADQVIDSLLADQRKAARSVLLRLVTEDGTRARRTGEEVTGRDARHRAALEALVRGRLLVARDSEAGTTYEVAHEALLSGWSRLAGWIAEDAETRSVRRRLESAALEWERLGARREALWGPQAVREADTIDRELLAEREQRFLDVSRHELSRRRVVQRAMTLGVVALIALAGGAVQLRSTVLRNRQIAVELQAAREGLARADATISRENADRDQAFRAFDDGRKPEGESAWAISLGDRGVAETELGEAGEHLERAEAVGSDRVDVQNALGEYLVRRAARFESQGRLDLRDLFLQQLSGVDGDGKRRRAFEAPAEVTINWEGPANVTAFRYTPTPDGHLTAEPLTFHIASGAPLSLPAGSYLMVREGTPPTRLPVEVARGEKLTIKLPAAPKVPDGFVFIPAGRFEFGSADEETIRDFLDTAPIHPIETPAFLISRTEVTWRDYLEYLDALPAAARAEHVPHLVASNVDHTFQVQFEKGRWELEFEPGSVPLHAAASEMLHWPARKSRADVDWLRMPVSGVDFNDAQAYARWLDESGRVPGARVCTEVEWERAGRGADRRIFPHGDHLAPEDANLDVTYGRDPKALGPDEVGSHMASSSPFGIEDMSGNVWEWTRSVLTPGTGQMRGGSYFHGQLSCNLTNRETVDVTYRNITVGMRVCAVSPR